MCFGIGNNRRPGARACQDCSEGTFDFGGDLYAKKLNLVMPSGRTEYRTCAGSFISLLVVIFSVIFLWLEFNHVTHENSYTIQEATARNFYSDKDAFPVSTSDSSLQIAFGIIDRTDNAITEVPSGVGKLEAWYRTTSLFSKENGVTEVYWTR